jgi:hypothetical protein
MSRVWCVVITGALFLVQMFVPLGIAHGALYTLPVLLSLRLKDARFTLGLAVAASVLVLAGFLVSPGIGIPLAIVVTNRALSLLLIWSVAVFGVRLIRAEQTITGLKEMITLCAWTKQVKVNGRWIPIEQYLRDHHHLELTHGISDDAAQQWRAEMEEYIKEKGKTA